MLKKKFHQKLIMVAPRTYWSDIRVPAMTMPSFTPTIRYDTGRSDNSVTITTLPPGAAAHLAAPPGSHGGGHQDSALHVHTGTNSFPY